jgi:hypothetical protein
LGALQPSIEVVEPLNAYGNEKVESNVSIN